MTKATKNQMNADITYLKAYKAQGDVFNPPMLLDLMSTLMLVVGFIALVVKG